MSRTIKINETLMLRRIDPVIMLRRYLAGEFKNVKIPAAKVNVSSSFINLNQRIGTDQTSQTYRFSDKTNSGQIIVTTNHEQYKYSKDKAESKSTNRPLAHCRWCRREIKTTPLGIPISMELNSNTNNVRFNVEDTYDTFGCAFASLKRIYTCHYMYKDPLYMDAEQLLHCMFYRMYPDKRGIRINEANDWRLLESNGGPLSDSEYDSDKYVYVTTPSIILAPVKRQYVKLRVGK